MAYPIDRVSYRTLDPDWEGQVFIADIDRTYLATRFSSLKGMARIPFEGAEEKRDIAGMAQLFREIRRGPGEATRETPLFFVSASPKQLRPVIERKMALDGIDCDGTTFKDWTRILRGIRFKRIKEQIGFKLTALLTSRGTLPEGAHEILIGDDLETDPLTYALYADTLAGRIPISDLPRVLRMNGVGESDAVQIAAMRRELKPGRGVLRAFIRQEKHRSSDALQMFGPGVFGCLGAFQIALSIWALGSISLAGVGRVASDLVARGIDPSTFPPRLADLVRRAVLDAEQAQQVMIALRECDMQDLVLPPVVVNPGWVDVQRRATHQVWTPAQYVGE